MDNEITKLDKLQLKECSNLCKKNISNDEEFLGKSNEDEIVIKNVDSDEELISKPLKSEEKQIVNADLYGLRFVCDFCSQVVPKSAPRRPKASKVTPK